MNSDFRVSVDFADHPKIERASRTLGEGFFRSWIRLLGWVARNRPDGVLSNTDAVDVAIAAGWHESEAAFCDELVKLRLLDRAGDGALSIHDWREHNQWAAEAKGRSNHMTRVNHDKWHVRRGRREPSCEFCLGGSSNESAVDDTASVSDLDTESIPASASLPASSRLAPIPLHTSLLESTQLLRSEAVERQLRESLSIEILRMKNGTKLLDSWLRTIGEVELLAILTDLHKEILAADKPIAYLDGIVRNRKNNDRRRGVRKESLRDDTGALPPRIEKAPAERLRDEIEKLRGDTGRRLDFLAAVEEKYGCSIDVIREYLIDSENNEQLTLAQWRAATEDGQKQVGKVSELEHPRESVTSEASPDRVSESQDTTDGTTIASARETLRERRKSG